MSHANPGSKGLNRENRAQHKNERHQERKMNSRCLHFMCESKFQPEAIPAGDDNSARKFDKLSDRTG